ncbi:hypothetical protein WG906_15225 [Pedobacter sp. P351]|uniref:hypothetical protein n=1 Tax=Pedobacter superstes TaxID=3133441 RepID=UPI0030A7AE7F
MESKIASSIGFLHHMGVEELYVVTTHWLSDIVFFEQEISYFQSLISRYFLPNIEEDNLLLIRSLSTHFGSLNLRKEQLRNTILQHQHQLSDLLQTNNIENESQLNVVHSELEGRFFSFITELRQIKLEFFNATKFSGQAKTKIGDNY